MWDFSKSVRNSLRNDWNYMISSGLHVPVSGGTGPERPRNAAGTRMEQSGFYSAMFLPCEGLSSADSVGCHAAILPALA